MREFVWKQTEQDQRESLRIQMRRIMRLPYYRSAQRRTMLSFIAIGASPVLVILLSNWDDQDAFSLVGGTLIIAILLHFLVIKKPSDRSLDRAADKQAEQYMKSLEVVPTGPHRLCFKEGRIEWEWVDGQLINSFPISSVISIIDQAGYLHIVRPNHALYSIPYHAFGDEATRKNIISQLKVGMQKGDNHD